MNTEIIAKLEKWAHDWVGQFNKLSKITTASIIPSHR